MNHEYYVDYSIWKSINIQSIYSLSLFLWAKLLYYLAYPSLSHSISQPVSKQFFRPKLNDKAQLYSHLSTNHWKLLYERASLTQSLITVVLFAFGKPQKKLFFLVGYIIDSDSLRDIDVWQSH